MYVLELSELAKSDFRDLLSYTQNKWGDRQRVIYRDLVAVALEKLAAQPFDGKHRTGNSYFSVRAGKHLIFYRIENDRVLVIRILHEKMNFEAHLVEQSE